MRSLVLFAVLLAGCTESVPASNAPDTVVVAGPVSRAPLRSDCYNSTVPPEIAPAEIRDLPQC